MSGLVTHKVSGIFLSQYLKSTGEIHEAFQDFIQSLPSSATSFRICFACSDRMVRDALALTCRSLSSFDKEVGARERLISLPWYSEDGIKHTAKAQTLSGKKII